ncbi:MAG: T9SS type A sorting domain-containing protein [Bacteroidetes bacterium]|nr:T9SS type A sorting domain-containing protein [Bacteroidota bacterium]
MVYTTLLAHGIGRILEGWFVTQKMKMSYILILNFGMTVQKFFKDTSDQIFDNAFENSIIVKPNPANKYLQISLESTRALNHYEFAVFNIAKQLVLKDSISGPNFTLDCSNFQEGLYFLLLFDGDKTY